LNVTYYYSIARSIAFTYEIKLFIHTKIEHRSKCLDLDAAKIHKTRRQRDCHAIMCGYIQICIQLICLFYFYLYSSLIGASFYIHLIKTLRRHHHQVRQHRKAEHDVGDRGGTFMPELLIVSRDIYNELVIS
jgi:hypothetical protein